jgi:hypothetical protein
MNSSAPDKEITLGSHFKMNLNRKLGNGAFGEIFQGRIN